MLILNLHHFIKLDDTHFHKNFMVHFFPLVQTPGENQCGNVFANEGYAQTFQIGSKF